MLLKVLLFLKLPTNSLSIKSECKFNSKAVVSRVVFCQQTVKEQICFYVKQNLCFPSTKTSKLL